MGSLSNDKKYHWIYVKDKGAILKRGIEEVAYIYVKYSGVITFGGPHGWGAADSISDAKHEITDMIFKQHGLDKVFYDALT